jgi:hypothetical protein
MWIFTWFIYMDRDDITINGIMITNFPNYWVETYQ